jgi:hypothetical protein
MAHSHLPFKIEEVDKASLAFRGSGIDCGYISFAEGNKT